VDAILQSAELREAKNRGQGLIVSGCLPQRFREELPKLLPEVDAFMGIDQVGQVTEIVGKAMERRKARLSNSKSKIRNSKTNVVARIKELDKAKEVQSPMVLPHGHQVQSPSHGSGPLVEVNQRPVYIPDFATPRFRLTPRHFAYVKIAEGCNHPCSFCTIPQMRGSHRSRKQPDIVEEARLLIADGVKELNLISQDSTYYGLDLRPNHSRNIASPEKFKTAARSLPADATTLCTLLRELNALPGDFWIRLLYTHPAHWTDELIATISECPKVARYVDMPLQHIHENMLERMRRETSRQYIEDLIAKIRTGIPGIALRTTFIVGFPGETEVYFESLLKFIQDTRFERLGVFTYSREEGTRAGRMESQVTEKEKQRRRARAMAEQHKVARHVSESFVGRTLKVLVEGEADAKQLKAAKVSSWEHGLVREHDSVNLQTRPELVERTRNSKTLLVARGEADAPDIDGRVYIKGRMPVGEFGRVRIVGHTDYDLIAEPSDA
jgi:ribosomal protein S12 methylthiotransferase